MALAQLTFAVLLLALGVETRKITIYNRCPFTIWPGIQGPGNPAGGGFTLHSEHSREITVSDSWTAGRIWARTGCDANFNCETGFCGNSEQCNGAGGVPPASLAEFTLNGHAGQDFYDVSMVDGYNIPVFIQPHGVSGCHRAGGCVTDMNADCSGELIVRGRDERVVACKSACLKYQPDRECCRNEYNNPRTCTRSALAQLFKNACPTAYSYAYDDASSTFTCQPSASYTVQFC